MLTLINLINIRNIDLGKCKLHLATGPGNSVLRSFFDGSFKRFQDEQHRKNFNCEHIIALIGLDHDLWLFVGVYEVLGVKNGSKTPYLYQTKLIAGLDDLIGRVVLRFERPARQAYIWEDRYGHLLEVVEIKPNKMKVLLFSDYHDVKITFADLQRLVECQEEGWKAALSAVQGVYLISDLKTGRLYVGGAYGEGGIWQRWTNYIQNGHGGNLALKQLIDESGQEYVHNFQFSILEIADSNTSEKILVERENHWKEVLLTRYFGYNKN